MCIPPWHITGSLHILAHYMFVLTSFETILCQGMLSQNVNMCTLKASTAEQLQAPMIPKFMQKFELGCAYDDRFLLRSYLAVARKLRP